MDISLNIVLTSLIICICIAEIYMEGSVSQNFDLGLSFCFMLCRRWNLEKNTKNLPKLPVFYHKIETRA